MTRPRVLVIDDSPLNAQLAEFVLASGGFEVRCAEDALAGIDAVVAFRPHVVLMDIQMPGMDGLQLTRQLKSSAKTAHIAVIAFTAFAMKGDEDKMKAAGCDGYISKPINVATFAEEVRIFLPTDIGQANGPATGGE